MNTALAGERWLILTQYYAPEIGAPQIRLRAMVAELRRRRIEVDVLTGMPNYPSGRVLPEYQGRWRCREEIDGVPVRRTWLYAATGKSAKARLANYLSFTLTASFAALTGPRPSVLFVESQPLSLGLCALMMKWLRGVPYIYNVPDLQIDVARQLGFMQNPWLLRLAQRLENLCLRHAWKVATVTHHFIAHFRERGIPAHQITFLPNGADATLLRPLPPSKEHLERWELQGKTVFGYVGTQAFYHGLDVLIDAAAELAGDPRMVVLIVGDGPERPRLEALAQAKGLTNVRFARNTYEEMPAIYSVIHASVATLRDVPVAAQMRLAKVFPSLSCGVPVIYAGRGEAADLIADNDCGLVVRPEDPRALAAAMRHIAGAPDERARMARAGRALVERDYSWSTIVGRWLQEVGLPQTNDSEAPAVPKAPVAEA